MKKVIITGGNGDIAKAIANELKKMEEYEIYLPTKHELDVTSIDQAEKYISNIIPDVLINNAGHVNPQSIKECDASIDKLSIDINLFGTFNCAATTLKVNKNAQIINIGSSAATKGHGTWSAYCASKAAVVMATKCWADDGVRAICISPGRCATKMRSALYPNENQNTLLKPEDFAKVVAKAIFGEYENGSHLNVNVENIGGYLYGNN